jgi:Rrf2 family transcriptional repressor of oqxAB
VNPLNLDKQVGVATPKWFGLALQSLVFLAKNEERCPSVQIAGHLCSEATLLRRILARLAKANIVEAREGRDGGYYLIKSVETITFADVYRAIQMADPLFSGLLETTIDSPFEDIMQSAFTEVIHDSEARILEVLEQHTIAELLQKIDHKINCT